MAGREELTEKQEAFAHAYVALGNAAEAYRQAYDVAETARDSWIYVEAYQVRDNPKVAARIEELRERAKERADYSLLDALDELEEARLLAMRESQPSAAVSAVGGKVKLLGLDAPVRQKVEHSSPDGSMTPQPAAILTNLTDEELEQLERLTVKATASAGDGETT